MIFIPIGLAAVAVILFLVGKSQAQKAYDMQSIETSSAVELTQMAADITKEIGPGSFTRQVEVKGVAECSSPLKSEQANAECVWYRATVTREYEETYTERDSEGRSQTRTRRGSESVSSNERGTPFQLRDATGTITIDPAGATLEGDKLASRFEQGGSKPGMAIKFGGLSLSFDMAGGRRTLGYKMEEYAITVGKRLYVLGEARDDGGQLRVTKPTEKGKRFLITVKSEEDMVKSALSANKALKIASLVLVVAAAASAILIIIF